MHIAIAWSWVRSSGASGPYASCMHRPMYSDCESRGVGVGTGMFPLRDSDIGVERIAAPAPRVPVGEQDGRARVTDRAGEVNRRGVDRDDLVEHVHQRRTVSEVDEVVSDHAE